MILCCPAQGQEEALGLSGQLSDARQQVATLSAALEQARTHLEAQQTALAQVRGVAACMPRMGEQRPQPGGREHSSRLVAQIGLLCFSEALKLYCAVCPPYRPCSNKPSARSWRSAPKQPTQRRRSSGRLPASCGGCWTLYGEHWWRLEWFLEMLSCIAAHLAADPDLLTIRNHMAMQSVLLLRAAAGPRRGHWLASATACCSSWSWSARQRRMRARRWAEGPVGCC